MKRFWRVIEIAAYVAFCLDLAFLWMNMLGDYHRITYDIPGSLGLPILGIIARIAHDKRGLPWRPGDY